MRNFIQLYPCRVDASLRTLARASRELRGAALDERLRSVPFLDRDAFVDELLELPPPPPDDGLPAGAVPYLPCPVDDILAFVRELPVTAADQVLVLGSGLGRVAFLVHLLTGASARGIEIQPHLVERARATAAAWRLDVAFDCGNVADRELDGSVVFLYAPCNGELLARVCARIDALARRRPIAIGAVGVELPYTNARPGSTPTLTLYEAR